MGGGDAFANGGAAVALSQEWLMAAAAAFYTCLQRAQRPITKSPKPIGRRPPQVPWLVIFAALTLAPQTAVCYYMMLAQWVSTRNLACRRQLAMAGVLTVAGLGRP